MEFHIYLIGSLCVAATILGAMVAHTDRGSRARIVTVLALWLTGVVLAVDFVVVWARRSDSPRMKDEQVEGSRSTPTPIAAESPPPPTAVVDLRQSTIPPTSPTPTPEEEPPARVRLSDVHIDVDSLAGTHTGLEVALTLSNASNTRIYVFAGPPLQSGAYRPSAAQSFAASASDDLGQRYHLETFQGFTQSMDAYFVGSNYLLELSPKESASVVFVLKFTMDGNWSPYNRKYANVNIEFAIVSDLRSKGSHRMKSLNLAKRNFD